MDHQVGLCLCRGNIYNKLVCVLGTRCLAVVDLLTVIVFYAIIGQNVVRETPNWLCYSAVESSRVNKNIPRLIQTTVLRKKQTVFYGFYGYV